jgi:CARDB
MRSTCLRLAALAATAALALAFATPSEARPAEGGTLGPAGATAASGGQSASAVAHASVGRLPGRRVRVRGSLGYGRIFARQQALTGAALARTLRGFQNANPAGLERPGVQTAGPLTPPTADAPGDGRLDARRRSDPLHPRAPRLGAASAERAPPGGARLAAANDFTLFRSIPVAQGTGVTSATGEPSVANDRNGLLFTGNFHAALSGDNGLTWRFLNPAAQFTGPRGRTIDGGFCCDQVAYAVDRGSYSLVFWLLQSANDGVLNPRDGANGRLRLVVYQGRQELLEQADYCTIDFKPSDFGFPANSWFDFNQVSHTRKFLYISSKAQLNLGDTDGDGLFNSTFQNGVVWRIALDDLDSDDCTPPVTAWSGPGTGFNPALVQGAGDGAIMHWASQGTTTDQIVITRLDDSSTTGHVNTVSISPYLNTERSAATPGLNGSCPLPDATDPCKRINDAINIGYTDGAVVGWFWNVRQGSGFPFPHIRGARFLVAADPASDPLLIEEPDIWNPSFAFFYPTVGVNSDNHVGLTAYSAGGGSFVRANAALIDDVTPFWASLSFNGIITSNSGVAGNTWGDYQSVREYGNCTGTYAGSVHSMQGGTANGNAEHRFAWFGREREGCADLSVVALAAFADTTEANESLAISQATRNIGSGTAGASQTRYYLSRNASKSDDDLLLSEDSEVPTLGRGASASDLVTPSAPTLASGTYYVLACADDRTAVGEISDTNNCMASPQTVSLVGKSGGPAGVDDPVVVADVATVPGDQAAPPGDLVPVDLAFRASGGGAGRPSISLRLNTAAAASGSREIARTTAAFAGGPRSQATLRRLRRQVRIPRGLARRRQFLIACVGTRPLLSRCLPAQDPIYVRGSQRR